MAGRVRHRKRGPVDYRRAPRTPEPSRAPLVVDLDLLEALRSPAPDRAGTRLPPTGSCYDCGRAVSGERRFCGPCLARHGRM